VVLAGWETVLPWPPATSLQYPVSLHLPVSLCWPHAMSAESKLVHVSIVMGQPPRPAAGHLGSREPRRTPSAEWTRKEYLPPETERSVVWNLLAHRSAAAPAVEARLSEKAAIALYD
jgi:hypothetical protein